jgi:hypothetical protein
MPKETITDTAGSYDVRVGWRPDDHVQVGVETAAGYSLLTMLYSDEDTLARVGRAAADHGWPQADDTDCDSDTERAEMVRIGREVLNLVEAADPAPDPNSTHGYTGVWSTLDRGGCNRLIRVLRRARDSAFGRDE